MAGLDGQFRCHHRRDGHDPRAQERGGGEGVHGGSPEYVLYDQLNKTGKTRPGTIAYPEFSSRFRAVINQIREGTQTTSVIVSGQASQLQSYLDRYSR